MRRMLGMLIVGALVVAGCGNNDDGDATRDATPDAAPETDPSESNDGASTDTSDAPTPDEADGESPFARTESFVNADGEIVEEIVLPSDLLEAVEAGVDEGLWSDAEGIALALGGITGQGGPAAPGLGGGDVIEPGLTALVRHGADLLAAGDLSETEEAELRAALAFFTPTQESLDAISRAADAASDDAGGDENAAESPGGGMQLIGAPVQETPVGPQCEEVASLGFPTFSTGGDCYLYREDVIDGNRLRVYYPAFWSDDEARMGLVSTTFVGLVRSTIVYAELAEVGDINAVFSVTDSSGGTTNAAQNYFDLSEACPITIYPLGTGQDTGDYLQTIAHETFHCVQDRTFTTAPYGTHKWWLEGSAVFFGNVVYPDNNKEHLRTPRFDTNSLTMNPTQMTYENTVFFQYYANRRGEAGTIELLRSISSGGATLAALSGIAGMEELWQDFVEAFMADAVLDTSGGGTVGRATKVVDTLQVSDVNPVVMPTAPMVATRYLVEYEREKRFVQNHPDSPLHASVEKAEVTNLDAWTLLPDEVRSKCDEASSHYVVTTVTRQDTGPVALIADVTEVETAECDPCLLGPWDLQLPTFAAYMGEVFASIGDFGDLTLGIEGNYYFDFDDQGGLETERRNLKVSVVVGGFGGPATEISGTEQGSYSTDGQALTISGLSGVAEASIGGGRSVQSIMEPSGGRAPYECDDNVLTINDPSYGPLTFDRIDEIPDPEGVEIEPGEAGVG